MKYEEWVFESKPKENVTYRPEWSGPGWYFHEGFLAFTPEHLITISTHAIKIRQKRIAEARSYLPEPPIELRQVISIQSLDGKNFHVEGVDKNGIRHSGPQEKFILPEKWRES